MVNESTYAMKLSSLRRNTFLCCSLLLLCFHGCRVVVIVDAFNVASPYAAHDGVVRSLSQVKKQHERIYPTTSGMVLHAGLNGLQVSTNNAGSTVDKNKLQGLNVAIVGGGPCGLLMAHALLPYGVDSITIYEGRPPPSLLSKSDRAYALGLGRRARTAIRQCTEQDIVTTERDEESVWQQLKAAGFSSERFDLRVSDKFKIRLRDADMSKNLEPSVLIYQNDLCRVLSETLEKRVQDNYKGKLDFKYGSKVSRIDFDKTTITTEQGGTKRFDVIFGCDGANSVVRKQLAQYWTEDFVTQQDTIPGYLKAVRLNMIPPLLEQNAISLLLPSKGACTAFVEPTVDNTSCILFGAGDANDPLISSKNVTMLEELLSERFPLLKGCDLEQIALHLANTRTASTASSVQCNTYHYGSKVALLGDAAHATGGVSGQGVNSALVDSQVMARCLLQNYDSNNKQGSLRAALLAYSQCQVPEGKALYELSFGPKPKESWKKALRTFKDGIDFVFKGRFGIGSLPLQTRLTLSLTPFADVRRERDFYYGEPFPTTEEWNRHIAEIDSKVKVPERELIPR